jgi:septal ring factor EnvC (AmiA/AmiB activator)
MSELTEVVIARIETKLDAIMDKLDRLEKSTDTHWRKISQLEQDLARLQERQGPAVPWVTWLIGIVALASLAISIIDKIAN